MAQSCDVLQQPLELTCGAILKNRLAKSAMSDSLGDGEGNPTEAQARLYERWAEGGAAVSVIGEVQGDPRYPEKPRNLVLGQQSNQQALQSLASRGVINGAHPWPQLSHAGALSHLPISKPKGPSALDLPGLQCAAMSIEEVQELPGLIIATGMSGHGFGIGPGFGHVVAHLATGKQTGFDLQRFRFNRFSDGSALQPGPAL